MAVLSPPNVQGTPSWKVMPSQIRGNDLHPRVSRLLAFTAPNPLGVVGVLSAFNFPVAVYGW